MPTIEEVQERLSRLEALYEDVIKERFNYISQRLDQICALCWLFRLNDYCYVGDSYLCI